MTNSPTISPTVDPTIFIPSSSDSSDSFPLGLIIFLLVVVVITIAVGFVCRDTKQALIAGDHVYIEESVREVPKFSTATIVEFDMKREKFYLHVNETNTMMYLSADEIRREPLKATDEELGMMKAKKTRRRSSMGILSFASDQENVVKRKKQRHTWMPVGIDIAEESKEEVSHHQKHHQQPQIKQTQQPQKRHSWMGLSQNQLKLKHDVLNDQVPLVNDDGVPIKPKRQSWMGNLFHLDQSNQLHAIDEEDEKVDLRDLELRDNQQNHRPQRRRSSSSQQQHHRSRRRRSSSAQSSRKIDPEQFQKKKWKEHRRAKSEPRDYHPMKNASLDQPVPAASLMSTLNSAALNLDVAVEQMIGSRLDGPMTQTGKKYIKPSERSANIIMQAEIEERGASIQRQEMKDQIQKLKKKKRIPPPPSAARGRGKDQRARHQSVDSVFSKNEFIVEGGSRRQSKHRSASGESRHRRKSLDSVL